MSVPVTLTVKVKAAPTLGKPPLTTHPTTLLIEGFWVKAQGEQNAGQHKTDLRDNRQHTIFRLDHDWNGIDGYEPG